MASVSYCFNLEISIFCYIFYRWLFSLNLVILNKKGTKIPFLKNLALLKVNLVFLFVLRSKNARTFRSNFKLFSFNNIAKFGSSMYTQPSTICTHIQSLSTRTIEGTTYRATAGLCCRRGIFTTSVLITKMPLRPQTASLSLIALLCNRLFYLIKKQIFMLKLRYFSVIFGCIC